jgi:hypothetical protein
MITQARALPLPQGGAIHITFSMPEDSQKVRITRTTINTPITDPSAKVLIDAIPDEGPYDERYTEDTPRGEYYDLETAPEFHNQKHNEVVAKGYSYHLESWDGTAWSTPVIVSATEQRRMTMIKGLDVKSMLFQRLSYYFLPYPKVKVHKTEYQTDQDSNQQVLVQTRAMFKGFDIGEITRSDGYGRHAFFTIIAEIRLKVNTSERRDEYGHFILERFLSDFPLFEAKGWKELTLNYRDTLEANDEKEPSYCRDFTLDGEIHHLVMTPTGTPLPDLILKCYTDD